jgi:hypothetical protein
VVGKWLRRRVGACGAVDMGGGGFCVQRVPVVSGKSMRLDCVVNAKNPGISCKTIDS